MNPTRQARWDRSYLRLCRFWALERSKDPSTKVCAVVVRPDMTIASVGYNGFPRGVADTGERLRDRAQKYPRVVHAEMNALLTAREPLAGCTMYSWPLQPCERCTVHVVQVGIAQVVSVRPGPEAAERYARSFHVAREVLMEAGAAYLEYDPEFLDDSVNVSVDTSIHVPGNYGNSEPRDDGEDHWFYGGDPS